ncbi:MAG: SPOR domain-containing protein [Candidatus Omnitrophica bacterium]|nr:SPOR domain-containing protein [Candidatus Omnitrophota bacterium]
MENENHSQLELFSQSGGYGSIKAQGQRYSFFGQIRNYEKKILLVIAFVITAIISFSLGVEKGKHAQLANTGTRIDMALKAGPPAAETPVNKQTYQQPSVSEINILAAAPAEKTIKQPSPLQAPGSYTIQVASFKNKSLAQQESDKLKKMGLKPLVLSRGTFAVVCVGNFPNKKIAQAAQSELKKRYGDCIIRRL